MHINFGIAFPTVATPEFSPRVAVDRGWPNDTNTLHFAFLEAQILSLEFSARLNTVPKRINLKGAIYGFECMCFTPEACHTLNNALKTTSVV